jgi:hypothetical protein
MAANNDNPWLLLIQSTERANNDNQFLQYYRAANSENPQLLLLAQQIPYILDIWPGS